MRALFTKKAAPKPAQKISASNCLQNGVEVLETILTLPYPKLIPDAEYAMDIFTAASLNSESMQRWVGGTANSKVATSFDKSPAEVSAAVNAMNVHKWTPLMYAAYLGHKETSQLLLSRGANPEARNESGQTSLMMASSCGSVDIVDILIRFSARINEQDKFGRAPLHYAVKYNQAKIVELLLSRGADPNLPDVEEMTPTLMACEVGNENTVAALLKHNGDVYRWNKHGENGAKLAFDHPKILTVLQQNRQTQLSKCDTTNNNSNNNVNNQNNNNNDTQQQQHQQQLQQQQQQLQQQHQQQQQNSGGDVDAILALLQQLGLEKYERNFAEHNVFRLDAFAALNDEKLNQMGVMAYGPRKKILEAVRHYHQHGTFVPAANSSTKPTVMPTAGGEEPSAEKSAKSEFAQIEAGLRECQRDLQHLTRVCMLQSHALADSKQVQAQAYHLLVQLQSQVTGAPVAEIAPILSALEQMDLKLNNLINEIQ